MTMKETAAHCAMALMTHFHRLQLCLGEVVHEVGVFERHIGISKICVRQGLLCYGRQTLPSNERLLDTDFGGGRKLVIKRKEADILYQRACARKRRRRVGGKAAMVRGGDTEQLILGAVEPNDSALPVVTMSNSLNWLILWPVPCIHDCELAVVGCRAGVDLTRRGAALAVRRTSRLQTRTIPGQLVGLRST